MPSLLKSVKIQLPKPTKYNDWLFGTFRSDKIDGLAGDDRIYGSIGSDRLSGGLGNDNLEGGSGKDQLFGGDGDDSIFGGYDADNLFGGLGDDILDGGDGNDKLFGGAGDDYLQGGDGKDRLTGDDGDDALYGGDDSDNLSGGNGNDLLDGGSDLVRDVFSGGSGNDTITAYQGDVALGGKDIDTLIVRTIYNPGQVQYAINLSKITGQKAVSIGSLNIKAGQFEKATLHAYNAADGSTFIGSKGNDTLYVSGTSGSVKGGAGNDYIDAYNYRIIDLSGGPAVGFTVNGGSGDDRIAVNGTGNILIGGSGSDLFQLEIGSNADRITDFSAKDFFLVSEQGNPNFKNVDQKKWLISGINPVATSSKGQFLYDTDDGLLFYDFDGVGVQTATHIATLTNKFALKASSFLLDL